MTASIGPTQETHDENVGEPLNSWLELDLVSSIELEEGGLPE